MTLLINPSHLSNGKELVATLPCRQSGLKCWSGERLLLLCIYLAVQRNYTLQPNLSSAVHKDSAHTQAKQQAWKQTWLKWRLSQLSHSSLKVCREQVLTLVRSGLLPLLLEFSLAVSPWYSSHGSPQLVLSLIGPSPSVFKTSTLINTEACCFLAKVLTLQPLYMWHSHWIGCR